MSRRLAFLFAGLLFTSLGLGRAEERILSFQDEITVNADGTLGVRENIRVVSEGRQIRHGIFRDFPTTYKDSWGNTVRVSFDIVDIRRDGQSEPYRLEPRTNGVRIYIGNKDFLVENGTHDYLLSYRTNRQLGFFKDHDELFWNVTGNAWGFAIEETGARVYLPSGISASQVRLSGYVGRMGSREASLTGEAEPDGSFQFKSARALRPEEGLTILLMWPKGLIQEPTATDKLGDFFRDNKNALIALSTFLLVLFYYGFAWSAVGKDPPAGVVVPLYYPPQEISPAEVRFIERMGFDQKVFTAAVVNMAVKGYLKITESGGTYTFEKSSESGTAPLGREEQAIFAALFASESRVVVSQINCATLQAAIGAGRKILKIYFEKSYFKTNGGWFAGGVLLSLLAPMGVFLSEPSAVVGQFAFIAVWLSIWSIGVAGLLTTAIRRWADVFRSGGALAWGGAIFISLFSLPFLAGEVVAGFFLSRYVGGATVVIFLATLSLHAVFYHLLKAPTLTGRKMMDEFEGFKMYLMAAEADELKLKNPPEKTPQLFEKYLPYALAFGVEAIWGSKFTAVLMAATAAGAGGYTPLWYHGSNWSPSNVGGWSSNLGGSFSNAISSASTPPGSSSGGGGGGGSGGGGGGGGGGGW